MEGTGDKGDASAQDGVLLFPITSSARVATGNKAVRFEESFQVDKFGLQTIAKKPLTQGNE